MVDIAKNLHTQLKHKKYQISLIHGDLSFHNIFLQDDNIFLIDWSDCRLDISSCDVSQLFYLLNFNEIQEKLFLKHYQMGYIDSQILKFHKVLLLMYDLADSNIKKLKINKNKMKKLDLLCSHFYD
jgi:Ser/Thr protein kinase RdoA (MazF antagonist)